jgi:hypothetical protein
MDARVCLLFLVNDFFPWVTSMSSPIAADLEVDANAASRRTASLCSRTFASFARFRDCLSIFLFFASSFSLSRTFLITCFASCSDKSDPKSSVVSSIDEFFSIVVSSVEEF